MWLLWRWYNTQKAKGKWLFFFLADGKLDVDSNGFNEEQPEAGPAVSQEDCDAKGSEEGEKASLQCDAGLECSQEATEGPLASEE